MAITSKLRTSKLKKANELEFAVESELGDRKRDFANELAVASNRESNDAGPTGHALTPPASACGLADPLIRRMQSSETRSEPRTRFCIDISQKMSFNVCNEISKTMSFDVCNET